MPQEEENKEEPITERGDGASPQSDDARDRLFAQFCEVTELSEIVSSFRSLCGEAGVSPESYEDVYPAVKKSLTAWKPASFWELLDKRAVLPEYDSQRACRGRRVLIVGAGPVGLRMAIEAAFLGARVDIVEKRDNFSRNNSLHLWPFLVTDLRNLCAKKFYGRFASGSLDHICIRILQGILLKVCLILGVQVHTNVAFKCLIEPANSSTGWKVSTMPSSCPVNSYEFDAILAADGKKNSLPGFKLKEFRAKLALAITVNFVNSNTQHENSVPEISGVSYVYRQDFFNSLAEEHGIELENIVYYKSETHYFVMTAKKPSLLKRGVLKKDLNDPKQLLSSSNINMAALKKYAVEAAKFSTNGALPLTFEKNFRGEDDIDLFDFTSLFASENAARIVERRGRRVLLCVAGDSLNEPFWPTGSGCGRGFLGAFDAAWMLKRFCAGVSPLELVEEREAMFYLLPQTTPERLAKNLTGYTINPKTRYLNLSELVPPGEVSHLYDTDNPSAKPRPSVTQQPPIQDPPKILKQKPPRGKTLSVSGSFGRLASQRSHSSEGLSAIAESTTATESAPPAEPVDQSASRQHNAREQSPAKQSPGSLRKRIQMLEAKEAQEVGTPKEKGRKEKEKKEVGKPHKKEAASNSREVSPKPSTGAGPQKPPDSPKRGLFRFKFDRSRSKSPSPSPSREEKVKEMEKKGRSWKKGETEANLKEGKEGTYVHHEQVHTKPTHPLRSVAKQPEASVSQSPPKPSQAEHSKEEDQKGGKEAQKGEDEPQFAVESVADIVKRLDPQQEASAEPGGKKKKDKAKKPKKEGKKADRVKTKAKEKHGSKSAAKETREKDEAAKSSRFLSFFKSKKSYDVAKAGSTSSSATASSSSPKLKKKKSKKGEKEELQHLAEKPQLSVQRRIQRLQELGVGVLATDSPNGPDISLEELEALEASSGIRLDEEEVVEEVRSRSVSPGFSDEGSESVSSRSRSMSPVYSGAEEERPQSRASHGSSGYGARSRGTSPIVEEEKQSLEEKEEEEEGGEEGEGISGEDRKFQRKTSVVETVRKLEPLSVTSEEWMTKRDMAKAQERKSKEFELAELHSKSKANGSNPLWLARIIQNMGRCLERLRREQNSILATKTTLQIISTILNNVQLHLDDDTYRRVRVSSQRFNQKVWQFSDAGQFLSRAGWVEIGDYIVLPMGQTVNIAKRVLEKHLNIVNQMLWSQQLELPDSPGVLKKLRGKGAVMYRNRPIATAVTWRQSYSSQVVDEGLKRVEKDQAAMEAALVRMTSTENGDRESSPDHFDPSQVSEKKVEEVRTMRAASAARSKWMERQKREAVEQGKDREYKLILESELYDLPQFSAAPSSTKVPSPALSPTPSPLPNLPTTPTPISPLTIASTHESPGSVATDSTHATESDGSPEAVGDTEETAERENGEKGSEGDDDLPVSLISSSTSPEVMLGSPATDAQYSTADSIRQDMEHYEKITLAAAQVRQKWMEAQDADQ